MPKEYPLFIIDRNRRSRDENHQYDYLVCLDKELGFVAKVILMQRDAYHAYLEWLSEIDDVEIAQCSMLLKSGRAAVVLTVVDFIYADKIDALAKPRIASLLKKALKKYMYAEVMTTPASMEYSLENQVKVLEDISKDLKSGYEKMAGHMGEKLAAHYIACVDKSIESLKSFAKIVN